MYFNVKNPNSKKKKVAGFLQEESHSSISICAESPIRRIQCNGRPFFAGAMALFRCLLAFAEPLFQDR